MSLVDSGDSSVGTNTVLAVSLAGTATAGNLLVLWGGGGVPASDIVSITDNIGTATWTKVYENNAGTFHIVLAWAVADGGEGTVTVTWDNSGNKTLLLNEFDDSVSVTGGSPKSAEDASNVNTAVTSQGTGTITPTGSGLQIAGYGADGANNWNEAGAGPTFATLTTQGADHNYTGHASRAGMWAVYGTGSNTSASMSTTDTGDEAYGCILHFEAAGAPATGGFSVIDRYYRQLMAV